MNHRSIKNHLTKIRHIILFLLACLWLTSSRLYAQSSPISAEVDRTSLTTDSTLTLTVVVNGNSDASPTLPSLDDFEIVGTSTSSQISIINGQMTVQATYRYTLQPLRAGNLVIEALTLTMDGQSYSTEPIMIEVTQGSAPSAPEADEAAEAPSELAGQDFFVEAEVDNATPYLGQQIYYTFRFYHAVRLSGQLDYEGPDFTGFWNNEENTQTEYTIQNEDRVYRVVELKTLLFPTIVGEHTIEPATLILSGFLSRGQNLSTEPVTVTIKGLPEGAPADFNGAVGEFDITASVDTNQVVVNDPVTLHVTLEGQGNIATLPEPTWPELADWRAFDRTSTVNTEVQQGIFNGKRVDEQLLVPTKAGEYTIPPISYTFFDPKTETYQTVSSEAISLTVLGVGEEAAESEDTSGGEGEASSSLKTDIRHIKNALEGDSESSSLPLTFRQSYWLAWLAPLALLLVDIGWQWGKKLALSRTDNSSPLQKALAQLSKASNESDLHSLISQTLNNYLADKLAQPVAGLTHNALNELLSEKALDSVLIERLKELLIQCDIGRFAPQAEANRHRAALLKESRELLSELERSFV